MLELPIIRVEIQSAKHGILRALDDRHEDLKRMVAHALDNALPAIQQQLDGMVQEAAVLAVRKVVGEAVEEAVEKLAEDVTTKLAEQIGNAVRKRVK